MSDIYNLLNNATNEKVEEKPKKKTDKQVSLFNF